MTHSVRFINSIHQVGLEKWNQLLNSDNPFLRFEFLAALEDSQCIDSPQHEQSQKEPLNKAEPLNSGWIPHYALLESSTTSSTTEADTEAAIETSSETTERTILAIAPVYKKLHSYGEYVFDWSWAEAYEKHGLRYYPKLVWAIPFTPSTGPRIISQGNTELTQTYYQQIAQGLTQYCQTQDYSSWHCLFPNTHANQALSSPLQLPTSNKIMWRQSCQFHWFNNSEASHKVNDEQFNTKDINTNEVEAKHVDADNNFRDFAHYLEKFSSRKRKNIKKERAKLQQAGFIFKQVNAHDITDADIKAFYHCYQLTYVKRNRRGYLTLEFFQQIIKTMPEQILLVQALYKQKPDSVQPISENPSSENPSSAQIVASALYFKDDNNLYGRYWGCLEEYDSLHFECCYYQGIEYCIQNNIHHFDPGTQGEHKISRGFEPTICASQHWIAHPQFSDAIDDFIKEENDYMQNYAKQVIEHLPFKHINSSTQTSTPASD